VLVGDAAQALGDLHRRALDARRGQLLGELASAARAGASCSANGKARPAEAAEHQVDVGDRQQRRVRAP
jgi:hypothetical protein